MAFQLGNLADLWNLHRKATFRIGVQPNEIEDAYLRTMENRIFVDVVSQPVGRRLLDHEARYKSEV